MVSVLRSIQAAIRMSLVFHKKRRPIGDFRRACERACRAAGVERTFHDLRRCYARNAEMAGGRARWRWLPEAGRQKRHTHDITSSKSPGALPVEAQR